MTATSGQVTHPRVPLEHRPFDVEAVRRDFPILRQMVDDRRLVYLDNAATSQKPQPVIDAIRKYYEEYNANIHRGVHHLSVRATEAYEHARVKVQQFLGASRPQEIVFVRGATEGINLVASAYGDANVRSGDEVIVSQLEHHSNIVPWQMLCERRGARLRVAPIDDSGSLMLDEYAKLLNARTKIVAVTHVSNALGTINPVERIVAMAHDHGAVVVVDGAQAAPHLAIDVAAIGSDFYTISSHKMFGPTGIGALFGRYELLNAMPPYQGGGDMIKSVTFEKTTYNDLPFKFEAGTPDIAGGIGFGAAVDYMRGVGFDNIAAHDDDLLAYATKSLSTIPEVRLIGTARHKTSVVSFTVGDVHAHDVGTILDQEGIAVRTGHHCSQPVMDRFGVAATVRASMAFYNTRDEIDALAEAVREVIKVFR